MPTALPTPTTPTPPSLLGQIVSRDSRLAEIIRAVTRSLHAINRLKAEVDSERAALQKTTNCVHGLMKACCATCIRLSQSGKSKQRASKTRRFSTMSTVWVGARDAASSELKKQCITRVVAGWEDLSGYYSRSRDGEMYVSPDGMLVTLSANTTFEPECLYHVEPKNSPYDPDWDDLRRAALAEHHKGYLNFCPRCWCQRVKPIHGWKPCLDDCKGLAALDAADERHTKKLEDYCVEMTAQRQREQLEARRLRESEWREYSPEAYDLEILESRGGVTAEAIRKFRKKYDL